MTTQKKTTIKIVLGTILALSGLLLLFIGLFCPPLGAIEPSVLAAYGEVSTFAAALIGIDALYKYRYTEMMNDHTERMKDKESSNRVDDEAEK